MFAHPRWRPRHTFTAKIALAAALLVLADSFFYREDVGFTVGVFALALLGAAMAAHHLGRRDRRAFAALMIAFAFGLVQLDHPTLLGVVLYLSALGVAVMSARAGLADDAWRWFQRLAVMPFVAAIRLGVDARRLVRRHKTTKRRPPSRAGIVLLPLCGGALFLWLFAMANPVIEEGLQTLFNFDLDLLRAGFWLACLIPVWIFLRPWLLPKPLATPGGEGDLKVPGVTVQAISLALVTFNVLFGLQNALDLAFLWGGAGLPDGMTLAEYAHRGAYPLIATALLAGLFVLVALAPRSASSRDPLIRWLVMLWVAQNLLLVASTMLRTIDYVEVYSLTRLRIAALAWMSLVAVGLVLICWRMLRARSASWLINANVLAAGVVLAAASVVDLGAVAAAWNVEHAAEVGGKGTHLDLCYLNRLGESAVVPLARLEQYPLTPELGDRVTWLRNKLMTEADRKQTEWRSWTWRGSRRLSAASALTATGQSFPILIHGARRCDGTAVPPPEPQPAPFVSAPTAPSVQEFPSPDASDGEMVSQSPLTWSQAH